MLPLAERIACLRRALRGPLPGHLAHRTALPEGIDPPVPVPGMAVQPAAVLLALHPGRGSGAAFPLIRRPDSLHRHAGQIALPGGVLEDGESPEAGALREAAEEVGIDPAAVDVVGRLTPVYIPVSRYHVQPVVGWLGRRPALRPAAGEVLGLLSADPDRLAASGPAAWIERPRDRVRFPAYEVEGEAVWGATAQILAEFLSVWRIEAGPGRDR
jgi:8-oxo-dGTP pyrophosphatase MutT (NUDIX family)